MEEETDCRSSDPCLENPVTSGVGAFLFLEASLAPSCGPETVRLWEERTGEVDRSLDAGRGKEIPLRSLGPRPRGATERFWRARYPCPSPSPSTLSLKLRFLKTWGLSTLGNDSSRLGGNNCVSSNFSILTTEGDTPLAGEPLVGLLEG